MTKTLSALLLTAATSVALAAPAQPFQGAWESCTRFDKKTNPGGYARFGGGDICEGVTLLQRGQNICGTWEYFANGGYEGKIKAVQEKANFARSQSLCGDPGSNTQVACDDKATSTAGWEKSSAFTLLLSRSQLFFNQNVPLDKINTRDGGLKYKALSKKQINKLMQDPAIAACLDGR